jgi:orotidine-5'-phosphate decarboxylase
MVTAHTFGGLEMMRAAQSGLKAGASEANRSLPIAVGVTVLTSLDVDDLAATGVSALPQDQVGRLAALAEDAGLAGVVASALEIPIIRAVTAKKFKVVTPGIRPVWADVGDQKRVTTPAAAAKAGADYIVVGRPITSADDSSGAAARIIEELALR